MGSGRRYSYACCNHLPLSAFRVLLLVYPIRFSISAQRIVNGLEEQIERILVVEIKALNNLDNSHLAQVIGYLAITKCPLGLLINFGAHGLQWKRILPPRNISEHQVNRQWLFVPDWLKKEK